MKPTRWFSVAVICALLLSGVFWFLHRSAIKRTPSPKKIVINEAVRTLLYIPLYHAKEKGYFQDENLDVEIVTGGTATNSFAAMLSGQAQFSQADPMYVPISREQGGKTKVVAQVVARIAVWGVTTDPSVQTMDDPRVLRGKRISTQVRPMTAYTYTTQLIKDVGLKPDVNVTIIQSQPGTELVPLLNKQADFAMTLEPQVTKAVQQGAHVVFSYPQKLGDQIFTGLMTTEDFIAENESSVEGVVRAYQHALDDIRKNPDSAVASAKKYFPQLDESTIRDAMRRMISDKVIPESVEVSRESWQKAIAVRLASGDLKAPVPNFEECVVRPGKNASARADIRRDGQR